MKQIQFLFILALTLNITSCGDDAATASNSSAVVSASPTPTSSPTPTPIAFVGNWIDSHQNTLVFNSDGTMTSNKEALNWILDSNNKIEFSSQSISVDNCSYEILSSGGLISNLIITLDLGCDKAGALSYLRAP